MASEPKALSVQAAAALLGVSQQTLRRWDRSGKLPATRHPVNGYRQYLVADLERLRGLLGEAPDVAAMATPAHGVLLGRQHELDTLRARRAAGQRVQTIAGPPGIGKTRLAQALCQVAGASGGAFLCDLGEARSEADVLRMVAGALGVPLTAGGQALAPSERVQRLLARRDGALLVLDGADGVVAALATLVARWSAAAPGVHFVVTSREHLRIAGEQVLELAPLALPAPGTPPAEAPAVQLFLARVRELHPGHQPGAAELELIAEITRQLEGVPLALELAAAQLAYGSAGELLARLPGQLDSLVSDRRDVSPGHSSLRAAIAGSWRALPVLERTLLARCSVFRGGFSTAAAEAVLGGSPGEVAAALRSLHQKSLLGSAAATGLGPGAGAGPPPGAGAGPSASGARRFALLAALRDFAAEHLDAAEAATVAARHATYYLEAGERWAAGLDQRGGADALGALGQDSDNLLALHARAVAGQLPTLPDAGLRAAQVLHALLMHRGPTMLDRELLDAALAAAPDAPPALRAQALTARAEVLRLLGEIAPARADLDAAAALAPASEPRLGTRLAWLHGVLDADQGRYAEARTRLEAALAAAAAQHDEDLGGRISSSLGIVAHLEGRLPDAERCYERAVSACHAAGNLRTEGFALANLANLHGELGHPGADAEHARAHALARAIGSRPLELQVAGSRAHHLHLGGELGAARSAYRAGLTLARELGDRRFEGLLAGNLATLCLELGALDEAEALYDETLAIFTGAADRRREVVTLALLAGVHAAAGHLERARDALARAGARLGDADDAIARDMLALSRAHLELGAARRAEATGDLGPALALREAALARLIAAETGAATAPPLVERWDDARLVVRLLRARLGPRPAGSVVLDARVHRLEHDGAVIALARRPVLRGLLYRLAAAGERGLDKASLARDLFGPGFDVARHDDPFRVSLRRLRALLAPARLEVELTEHGYRLRTPPGFIFVSGDAPRA